MRRGEKNDFYKSFFKLFKRLHQSNDSERFLEAASVSRSIANSYRCISSSPDPQAHL